VSDNDLGALALLELKQLQKVVAKAIPV